MDIRSTFAERLKDCREKAHLKQTELADKLGVSRGSISFYENGDRTADIEFLSNAAKFFDVSTDWLLGLTKVKSTDPDIQAVSLKYNLSERALNKLRNWGEEIKYEVKYGNVEVPVYRNERPAPEQVSQIIEHSSFDFIVDYIITLMSISDIYEMAYEYQFLTKEEFELIKKMGPRNYYRLIRHNCLEALESLIESLAPTEYMENKLTDEDISILESRFFELQLEEINNYEFIELNN